jgi:uncharacterized phiE125 gp8 family phage protein
MALSIVNQTTFEPVGLKETKDRLRVSTSEEDDLILNMIRGATKWAEHELNWRLCTQTWKYFLDCWPYDIIRMPYPPLQSVTHIKYYDGDDAQQTLVEGTDYRVDSESYPARIEPIDSWPTIYDKVLPIEIQFVCGFANTEEIAEDIKDAIFLRTADLYEHRQNSYAGGVNNIVSNMETAHDLLMRYKLYNEVL